MHERSVDDKSSVPEINTTRLAGWVFGGVLATWAVWLLFGQAVIAWFITSSGDRLTQAGQFGDMFGSLNSLFTALAFAAVFWSATMQRNEMAMQRRELELQRHALQEQRSEMKEQSKVFAQQTFESTFFQTLRMCRELHDSIAVPDAGLHGSAAVKQIASACERALGRVSTAASWGARVAASAERMIGEAYETEVYPDHAGFLGPYFRSLYHLFKLIDVQAGIGPEQKASYANLARAHLSRDVLVILAVNACSRPGAGFVPNIERYRLLKHLDLPESQLDVLRRCFNESAFGETKAS